MVGFVFQQIREGKNEKTCGMVDQNPTTEPPDSDFAIHFPHKGTADYIQVWGMPRLTQFTVCSWTQSNDTTPFGTLFSYAVLRQYNEIVISYGNGFKLQINGESRMTSMSANDGMWHHLCVCWNNTNGAWKFYKDYYEIQGGKGLKKGYEIPPKGSLIMTQEQDSFGGGFNKDQSFQGMLTNVNMWDHVLPPEKIRDMSQSCLAGEGNVYKWSDFKDGLKGTPRVVIPSSCKSPTD
ncbi:neuronal pentraxin-1-like [Oculina patagonica]